MLLMSSLITKFALHLLFPAEFEDDPDLYVLKPIKYVGIEVWQVCVYIYIPFVLPLYWLKEHL